MAKEQSSNAVIISTGQSSNYMVDYARSALDLAGYNPPEPAPVLKPAQQQPQATRTESQQKQKSQQREPTREPVPPDTEPEYVPEPVSKAQPEPNELTLVRERMKPYYDRTRSSAPTFRGGDKVYLLRRNIKNKRPSDNLDYKKLGPFKVLQKVSTSNYRLELPKGMRQRPTFHVSLLEPAPKDEYLTEAILDSQIIDGEIKYLIKWQGYGHESNTWEPPKNLVNLKNEIEGFHRRFPDRPQPPQATESQGDQVPAPAPTRQDQPRANQRRAQH